MWFECDWTNYYDSSRPTESSAFRNVKLQTKFYLKFKNNKGLTELSKKIMKMERQLMIDGVDNKNIVVRISNKFGISELKVKETLNFVTTWLYFKEIYDAKI